MLTRRESVSILLEKGVNGPDLSWRDLEITAVASKAPLDFTQTNSHTNFGWGRGLEPHTEKGHFQDLL